MENPKTLTPDEQAAELLAQMRADYEKQKAAHRKSESQTKTFSGAGTEKRGTL